MKTKKLIFYRTFAFICLLLVVVTLSVSVTFCSYNYDVIDIDKVKSGFEEAYFEGQKDALEGDIRIRKNSDGCWIWTKSCWDSGTQPTFNPSIVCNGGSKK